jgi:hypothetical protein
MNYHGKLDRTHVKVLNALTKDVVSGLTQKAQFIIDYNEQGVLVCKWISKRKKRSPIAVHPVILNFFQNLHNIAVHQNTRSGVFRSPHGNNFKSNPVQYGRD